MRYLIALVLVLCTASLAGATEKEDRPTEPERAEPVVTEQATERAELILTPVVLEERTSESEETTQDMPRRGSFWWVVGAIVVAGVILAVLL